MSLNPILFIISQIGIRPAFGANDGSINSGVMQSILTNFLLLFRFTISDSLFRRFFVLCWVYYTRSGVYCVGCFPGKFKTNRRIQGNTERPVHVEVYHSDLMFGRRVPGGMHHIDRTGASVFEVDEGHIAATGRLADGSEWWGWTRLEV